MNVTFKTPSGDEMVIIPRAEYDHLLEATEMAEDVAAFDRSNALLAAGEEESIPAEFVDRMINGENPLRVWRQYRGVTSKDLAQQAGISVAYLSEIETGKKDGSISAMKRIADALKVTVDDII